MDYGNGKVELGKRLGRREAPGATNQIKTIVPVNLETGAVGQHETPLLSTILPEAAGEILALVKKEKLGFVTVGLHRDGCEVTIIARKHPTDEDFYKIYSGACDTSEAALKPFAQPKPNGGRYYAAHDRAMLGIPN